MMEGMYTPVAGLGIVPGNATADNRLIEMRQKNARNPMRNTMCYPGGDAPQNHSLLKGDLLFAQRGARCLEDAEGGMQQAVTATVNGECWADYTSQREMEHSFVFAGISAGDQMLEHPLSGDRNEPTGVGTVLVGTISTINNGPRPFYCMDWISVKWPDSGLTPNRRWYNRYNINNESGSIVNGGDPDHPGMNMLTYSGDEPTVFKPQVVPFNPALLDVELAGVFSCMVRASEDGGVSNAKLEQILPHSSDQLKTSLQEESATYEFALFGMFRAMLEPLLANGTLTYNPAADRNSNYGDAQAGADAQDILTKEVKLFNRSGNYDQNSLRMQMLANVFMPNIGGFDTLQKEAIDRFAASRGQNAASLKSIANSVPQTDGDRADYIRAYGMELMVGAMAKTVHAQREKIIGRCLNASACGETLDVLLGHTN